MLDAVVIGAGIAGLAATRHLLDAGRQVQCLEARDRIGGRAQSLTLANGARVDRGCHWLHSSNMNPLVGVAERLGFLVDHYSGNWADPWSRSFLGSEQFAEMADYRAQMLDEPRELLASGKDRPLSELLPVGHPWNGYWSAIITYVWGASPSEISALGHAMDEDSGVNARLALGYGTMVARYADGLPVMLDAPVTRIALTSGGVLVESTRGRLEAKAVVITVPASLLAADAIAFDPALPDSKRWALEGLPLGSDNKVHFAITGKEPWPEEEFFAHFFYDRERTGQYHFHPFGQPLVETYLGGPLSSELVRAGPGEMAAFALDEIASHYGSAARRCLSFLHATDWDLDPWSLGAYSYARPGYSEARARLAEPLEERLFFAGEACHPGHPASAHGAYLSGIDAADDILSSGRN